MKIRLMKKSDRDEIFELVRRLSDWFSKSAREETIPTDIESHKVFIAEDEGRIVGFVSLCVKSDMPEISWIGVNPNYQEIGIGKKLLDRVESEVRERGFNKLRVETVSKECARETPYEGTVNFYESVGFKLDRIVENYWDDGETDKAVYVKEIS